MWLSIQIQSINDTVATHCFDREMATAGEERYKYCSRIGQLLLLHLLAVSFLGLCTVLCNLPTQ